MQSSEKWLAPIKAALIHFNAGDGWAMASHVAMSLMIAVFPFLIFAVSLTGMLGADRLSDEVVHLVFDYWPETIAKPIVNEINAVVATASKGYLTFGGVLAIFFAANGIEAIRVALNRAYGDSNKRSIWKLRLQSVIFVIVGAILMLLISMLLVFLPVYFSFMEITPPDNSNWSFLSVTARWSAAFGLLIFFIIACHYWLPGHRRPISQTWPGILTTLVLWAIAGAVFSFYLDTFANYSATYAGLAGIMTALIFLYLMAVIFIFGAEYNSALQKSKITQGSVVPE